MPVSEPQRSIVALLVDPDPDCLEMHGQFLRDCGCEVDEAHDGRQALAKALSRRPDIIVITTRLPGMNGFDLCRMIRVDDLTSSIPIVVLTDDRNGEGRHALSVGADSVLPRACPPGTLFTEIRTLLEKSDQVRTGDVLPAGSATPPAAEPSPDRAARKRVMLSHVFGRHVTTTPPIEPPDLSCPHCSRPLVYTKSYIGGVSARHPEQWDYFECQTGCGGFEYRHRTRRLRRTT